MTTTLARADLAKLEARLKGLHDNGDRFREALERRLMIVRRSDARRDHIRLTEITGDRRDVEAYAASELRRDVVTPMYEFMALRVAKLEEHDPDRVTLTLSKNLFAGD